jgi:hypothetical protein
MESDIRWGLKDPESGAEAQTRGRPLAPELTQCQTLDTHSCVKSMHPGIGLVHPDRLPMARAAVLQTYTDLAVTGVRQE